MGSILFDLTFWFIVSTNQNLGSCFNSFLWSQLLGSFSLSFLKMGQSRPLFVYFRYFLDTISIIQIEKSIDGVLGIRTQGRRMVGADETTELWRPPQNFHSLYFPNYISVFSGDRTHGDSNRNCHLNRSHYFSTRKTSLSWTRWFESAAGQRSLTLPIATSTSSWGREEISG